MNKDILENIYTDVLDFFYEASVDINEDDFSKGWNRGYFTALEVLYKSISKYGDDDE